MFASLLLRLSKVCVMLAQVVRRQRSDIVTDIYGFEATDKTNQKWYEW